MPLSPLPIGAGAAASGLPLLPYPSPAAPVANVSSRQITLGAQVLDADGNFASMPDLHQRVMLLVAYGVTEPAVIGNDFAAEMTAQIRNALRPLTDVRPPAAKIERIEVTTAPGASYRLVVFQDGTRIQV
jgi:hypothetical protein